MKTKKIFPIIAAAILLGGILLIVSLNRKSSQQSGDLTIDGAMVKEVESMVRLCSMDIYEETPVKATIGNRHLFGRITLKGSITFDLERIVLKMSGDTLRVQLPPEKVEILESTDKDSYIVIDTWNDRFMGSGSFTTAEENKIKEKVKQNAIKSIYRKGYVKRARAEAAENLTAMLSALTSKPVVVTDPTPEGNLR
ncbi:MAG: hypothetical protein DBY35_04795 [Bacteroidales bacterium]|nr:MAG: hypothetical protein DBY35_04795 [Bacteroidales bacterium]